MRNGLESNQNPPLSLNGGDPDRVAIRLGRPDWLRPPRYSLARPTLAR